MSRGPIVVAALLLGPLACASQHDRPPAAGSEPIAPVDGGGAGPTSDPDIALGTIISAAGSNEWELETEVAMAPNGRDAFVIWMIASLGYRYNVGYARSSDGGATWSTPHRVPTAPDVGVNACVTSDASGVFHVTWLENPSAGRRRVMAATYVPTNDVFTVPVEVSDPNAPAALDKPWIVALGNGGLLVAYGTDSGSNLVAARSADGAVWSRTTIAPDANLRNIVFPCTAGARVHIAYLVPSGVELVTSEDNGVTFGAPTRVDAPGSTATAFEPPSCAAAGDDVWVAYGVGGGLGSTTMMALLDDVMVAHSKDGGRTIASRVSPTDKSDGKHFLLPRLGKTPSGTLALGYYTGDSAGALGRFRVAFSSGGDAWAARATLKNPLVLQPSRTGFDSVGDYVGMHALGDGASGVLVSFADNASVAGTSQSHIRMARVVAP